MDESKETIEILIKTNNMFPVSYKFWNPKDGTMHKVKSIRYNEQGMPVSMQLIHGETELLAWNTDGILIPSTGLYDQSNDEIYMGDIVLCGFLNSRYKTRVVIWDNGWRVVGCTTEEFKNNCEQFVSQIGNIYENEDMYKTYQEKFQNALK